ncbi:MAG TPA: hypothetical protein VH987_08160 [Candidatus Limnocylindria bacterium]|jgi:hypothetical protein
MPRRDLDRLTRRWQQRHDARRPASDLRPRATGGREALARRGFPFATVSPVEYVAQHGDDMPGFTYDDESYADPALDAWILEVGRLLRERREGATPEPSPPEAAPDPAPQPKPKAARKPKGDA